MDIQYKITDNLATRIWFHKNFSINKQAWHDWVIEKLSIQPGMKVLELGSGTGVLWQSYKDDFGEISLVLSDFSQTMVESLVENYGDKKGIDDIKQIRAEAIPYDDETFDLVIANHMLYHVNLETALAEIKRVLKPNGKLFASTMGERNMEKLHDLVYQFDQTIDYKQQDVCKKFSLENGRDHLKLYFDLVETLEYKDAIYLEEASPLIKYLLSMQGYGDVKEQISDNLDAFKGFVEKRIKIENGLTIKKSSGAFITKK